MMPYEIRSIDQDASQLLAAAKHSGVRKMCLFSLHPDAPEEPTIAQCRQANDYVLAYRDIAPEVVLPFCYVNPRHTKEAVREIERCVGKHRMVGIKLWVSCRASDPLLDPILETAVAFDVPVLQHAWLKTSGNLPSESTPEDVAKLAKQHLRARIIMSHLNGHNPRGLEAVADCPNVVVDTSGGDPESGMVELAVSRLGSHRVVYGSDAPIRHFAVCLAKVLGANLPQTVIKDILWNNAAQLLPPWAEVSALEDEK
jgi:predicted TIM-barrel fold metal-dependent hydrolase